MKAMCMNSWAHVACMLKDEADLVTHSCRGLALVGSPWRDKSYRISLMVLACVLQCRTAMVESPA